MLSKTNSFSATRLPCDLFSHLVDILVSVPLSADHFQLDLDLSAGICIIDRLSLPADDLILVPS
jgi:hypothetical protein